jgi:hypothetical protein
VLRSGTGLKNAQTNKNPYQRIESRHNGEPRFYALSHRANSIETHLIASTIN